MKYIVQYAIPPLKLFSSPHNKIAPEQDLGKMSFGLPKHSPDLKNLVLTKHPQQRYLDRYPIA